MPPDLWIPDGTRAYQGGETAGDSATRPGGGGVPPNNTQPCPCDCRDVVENETWYISRSASQYAIPFDITKTHMNCDPYEGEQVYDPKCPEFTAALQQMGYTGVKGISGLNCGHTISGLAGYKPGDGEAKAKAEEQPYYKKPVLVIGAAAAVGGLTYLFHTMNK